MNKKNLLLICLCVTTGLLAFHLFKPVAGPSVSSANPADQMVFNSINSTTVTTSNFLPIPVAEPALATTGQDSHALVEMEPAITNTPAETNISVEDEKGVAEKEKHQLLGELRELAAKNPEGALAEAMKLPTGDERNQALSAVCFGLAQVDPAAAVKMAKSLHLEAQPGAIVERLVQQWAASDSSTAIDWVNSQPADEQRDGLNTRIAYALSQTDPAGAANLVLNQISPGPAQNEAVMAVLYQWANQNLMAATVWVKGFPDGPLRERAVGELEEIANRQRAMANQ